MTHAQIDLSNSDLDVVKKKSNSISSSSFDFGTQNNRNAEEQRNNEIRASIRSLKTNLLIPLVIALSATIIDPLPLHSKAYVMSLIKAVSNVTTIVVNFGKVKQFLFDVKENLPFKCCEQEV